MKRRLNMLGLVLFFAFFFAGCVAKKKLDEAAQTLIIAVQNNDFAAFQSISHPLLVQQFPKAKFTDTHLSFKALGAFQSRSMRGIKTNLGGPQSGSYQLTYQHGKARLEISLMQGKLMKFGCCGKDVLDAVQKFRSKKYGRYMIEGFEFLDAKGVSNTSNMAPPGKVFFFFFLQDLAYRQKQARFSVVIDVQKDAGPVQKLVLLNQKVLPYQIGDTGFPVAHVRGNLNFPVAGTYKMTFLVTDHHSNKSLRYIRAFVIQK